MKKIVKCKICKKTEEVFLSRSKNYKTCSKKCSGEYRKKENNVKCTVCENEFHVKPIRVERVKNGICCSKKCTNKLKKTIYMGRENPNTKYYFDDNFFKKIETEEKAYFLGWIASDGHLSKLTGSISIKIHEKDRKILECLRDIICKEINVVDDIPKSQSSITINSTTIVNDICKWLNINPGKKSDIIEFPELENDFLKWAFIRGFFDGDGSVRKFNDTHLSPECSISCNSIKMRESIVEFCEIPCNHNKSNLTWNGNNALDFLFKLYNNSKIKLDRKYELYLEISTWSPSVSYSRHWNNELFKWSKTRKDAVAPTKVRASDSGFDLVLLEKIKTVGDVEFYDTGVKVRPTFGIYFELVPRSSISKTGYMLANSIGIIDRTYHGNIIVALRKVDKNASDIELPNRAVQIIPKQIIHCDFEEVDGFEEITDRNEGGFGSTGLK